MRKDTKGGIIGFLVGLVIATFVLVSAFSNESAFTALLGPGPILFPLIVIFSTGFGIYAYGDPVERMRKPTKEDFVKSAKARKIALIVSCFLIVFVICLIAYAVAQPQPGYLDA